MPRLFIQIDSPEFLTLPKTPDKIEKIRFPFVNRKPHFCASHRLCLLTTNGLTFYQKC